MASSATTFSQQVLSQQQLLAPYPTQIAALLPGFGFALASRPSVCHLMNSARACEFSVASLRLGFHLALVASVALSLLCRTACHAEISVGVLQGGTKQGGLMPPNT